MSDGKVRFQLWAPSAPRELALEIEGMAPIALAPDEQGFACVDVACQPGARYRYRLGPDLAVPDPASRLQDGDVHDASVVVSPLGYAWRHPQWRGRPWEESVIYEVHAGLAGGFKGLQARLPELAELGVTMVELMPIADFPGRRNWGYDGVLPFAPDTAYGTPEALKELVDTAHGLGMGMMLDVVYNHFGPDGNYLPQFARPFFREDIRTPWGAAIDFRQPAVRRYFQENALYWLSEFRFDGLRLDAVHAIADHGWLPELAGWLREQLPGRYVHLVLENDANAARLLEQGYDAQWNDDAHHVVHHLLTGETRGYYGSYAQRPAEALARALAQGYVYQGEPSPHHGGEPRGEPSAHLPPTSFVFFLQNHDQVGNRAQGERLSMLVEQDKRLRAAVALQLLCPHIPLVFMGEEDGSREPFLYFTDHQDPALAQAVREGRRAEFKGFYAGTEQGPQVPDPNAESTYRDSFPWHDARQSRLWRPYYQQLLRLRHECLSARLAGCGSAGAQALGSHSVMARWYLADGAMLTVYANLGAAAISVAARHLDEAHGPLLFESEAGARQTLCEGMLLPGAIWTLQERL
ncbi:malto-oligosyltrehalose trehalohydrolase [Orrella sp. JC864]|uniref:malto-oligosyltrehalose trehalohydrolase n=1 Tax=Orrella sp. JC864 TaxID=3120298 RepID=UPI00300A1220